MEQIDSLKVPVDFSFLRVEVVIKDVQLKVKRNGFEG